MNQTRNKTKGEKAGRYAAAGLMAFGTLIGVLAASAAGNPKLRSHIASKGIATVHSITETPMPHTAIRKPRRVLKTTRTSPIEVTAVAALGDMEVTQ